MNLAFEAMVKRLAKQIDELAGRVNDLEIYLAELRAEKRDDVAVKRGPGRPPKQEAA